MEASGHKPSERQLNVRRLPFREYVPLQTVCGVRTMQMPPDEDLTVHHKARFKVQDTCRELRHSTPVFSSTQDSKCPHRIYLLLQLQVRVILAGQAGIKGDQREGLDTLHLTHLRTGTQEWVVDHQRSTTARTCRTIRGPRMLSIRTSLRYPIRNNIVPVPGLTSVHSTRIRKYRSAGEMPRCGGMMVNGI